MYKCNFDMEYRKTVGRNVRSEMYGAGMYAQELSDKSGIPRARLYLKMRGEQPFNVDELYAIAQALNLRPAQLLSRSGSND